MESKLSKVNLFARQGDVGLARVDSGELPVGRVTVQDNVLAYGEVSGHKHQVKGAVVTQLQEQKFVEVTHEGAQLVHEEHGVVDLPVGVYAVIQQVEYTPRGMQRVQD